MKKFLNNILAVLKFLFGGKLDAYVKDHAEASVDFLMRVKSWIDSPLVDLIVTLFPGDADDRLRRDWSNKLAVALKILVPEIVIDKKDLQSQIQAFSTYLKTLSPAMQRGAWLNLSVEIARASSNIKGVADSALVLANQNVLVKKKFDIDVEQLPAVTPTDLHEYEATA